MSNVMPTPGTEVIIPTPASPERKPRKAAQPAGGPPETPAAAPATAPVSVGSAPTDTGLNLLDLLEGASGTASPPIEMVRLGTDETAVILFTPRGERVHVHYCQEPEIGGYVRCNGTGCTLCAIGRRKDERILIPVYLPAAGAIGVLPVSPVLRPHALFPQLGAILKVGKPLVAFIQRDREKFKVSTTEIGQDVDAGETAIKAFMADFAAGRVKLLSVIATYSNEQFAEIPAIARMLALKGGTR